MADRSHATGGLCSLAAKLMRDGAGDWQTVAVEVAHALLGLVVQPHLTTAQSTLASPPTREAQVRCRPPDELGSSSMSSSTNHGYDSRSNSSLDVVGIDLQLTTPQADHQLSKGSGSLCFRRGCNVSLHRDQRRAGRKQSPPVRGGSAWER